MKKLVSVLGIAMSLPVLSYGGQQSPAAFDQDIIDKVIRDERFLVDRICGDYQQTQKRYEKFFNSSDADKLANEGDAAWKAITARIQANSNSAEFLKIILQAKDNANRRVSEDLLFLDNFTHDFNAGFSGRNPSPLKKTELAIFSQHNSIRHTITEVIPRLPYLEALGVDDADATLQSEAMERQRWRLNTNKVEINVDLTSMLERAKLQVDPILAQSIIDAIELQVEARAIHSTKSVRLPAIAGTLQKQCVATPVGGAAGSSAAGAANLAAPAASAK
jgi:hypothetical protein